MPLVIPTIPTLPTTFSVPYQLPTGGTTWTPHNATDFQTALDNSALGDVIILDAGVTYEGNFKLPIKSGSSWLYIISSNLASLPTQGHRVGPSNAANMPCILSTQTLARPGIATFKSAHHYRFVGIEFKCNSTGGITAFFNLIQTGYGSGNYSDPSSTWAAVTSDADLPSYFVIDRCYIHSENVFPKTARCGFIMNGHYMSCLDSYISNWADSADSQAINIWNGGQYYQIINNYLDATGENFMCGGTDPAIAGSVSSDIEFRGNYLYKDSAVYTSHFTIKNLFELKFGIRVLCSGNVMQNCYRDNSGQSATAIVLTPRNQSGGDSQAQVADITISYNRINTCGEAWRMIGYDDLNPSQQTQRVLLEHNAWDNMSLVYSGNARAGQISTVQPGPALDVTVRHNLGMANGAYDGLFFLSAPTPPQFAVQNWLYENNIICHGDFGLFGNGTATGNTTLTHYVVGYDTAAPAFRKNVMINRPIDRDYDVYNTLPNGYGGPTSGNKIINDTSSVGFTDIGSINTLNANYQLTPASPYYLWANDGTDPGPDWNTLSTLVTNVFAGISPLTFSPPEPPIPPTPAQSHEATLPTVTSFVDLGFSNTGKREGSVRLLGPTSYATGGFTVDASSFALHGIDHAIVIAYSATNRYRGVAVLRSQKKPDRTLQILVLNGFAEVAAGTDLSATIFRIWAIGN